MGRGNLELGISDLGYLEYPLPPILELWNFHGEIRNFRSGQLPPPELELLMDWCVDLHCILEGYRLVKFIRITHKFCRKCNLIFS